MSILRKIGFLLAAALVLQGSAVLAAEEAPLIQPESASILSGEADASVLLDGSRQTKWRSEKGEVTFTLPQSAQAIYLEWDFAPDDWTVTSDGTAVTAGTEGYIHYYMPLFQPSTEISLSWEGDATLCDVYFLGEGTLPDFVQEWEPPCDKADFLLLPTHADDEHLWFGGVMPLYAGEQDLEVQVAYMVQHNTEPYRLHEQLDGLWKVGVENYPVIPDYPDVYSDSLEHARTIYNEDEIIAYQVGLIRRFQPSVIVGHDINGEYGHGAHRLNTDALMQSVELAADPTAYPEVEGVWDTPKTYLHLYPENAIVMDWDQPLSYFGGKTAFEMAKEGFACHASQTQYFKVEQTGSYDCRKFGLYRSTVGPDTTADMTENLPKRTTEPDCESQPVSEPESMPVLAVSQSEPADSQPAEPVASEEAGEVSTMVWPLLIGVAVLTTAISFIRLLRRR